MKKRILSVFLAVCLTLTGLALPASAFTDVQDPSTAVDVECLRLLGVLDGYADGSFRPNTVLNRAQFCKMAVYAQAAQKELGKFRSVTVFPDVKPSHWASAYINMAAKGEKIISGYADGTFAPGKTVTLGHAVTITLRMLGYTDEVVGGVLQGAAALRLVHGGAHGAGNGVGVEDDHALRVTGGTADGLDETGLAAEETLLVGVQNSH